MIGTKNRVQRWGNKKIVWKRLGEKTKKQQHNTNAKIIIKWKRDSSLCQLPELLNTRLTSFILMHSCLIFFSCRACRRCRRRAGVVVVPSSPLYLGSMCAFCWAEQQSEYNEWARSYETGNFIFVPHFSLRILLFIILQNFSFHLTCPHECIPQYFLSFQSIDGISKKKRMLLSISPTFHLSLECIE